jgi:hypothetical protein
MASIRPVWRPVSISVSGSGTTLKTQRFAQLLGLRIPCGGRQSELAEIIRRAHRHFGKEIDPTAFSPAQQLEVLVGEALFQFGGDAVSDLVQLLVGGKQHRDVQTIHAAVDERQTRTRDSDGVEPLSLDFAYHLCLTAEHTASIDA